MPYPADKVTSWFERYQSAPTPDAAHAVAEEALNTCKALALELIRLIIESEIDAKKLLQKAIPPYHNQVQ